MRQQTSPAIVLRRTNYGEADRIVTFLTPIGKIKAIVKGVRRSKSKLAGGIELFSESTVTFLETRGGLQRIVSTRLDVHWDGIVGDLQRMMFGYEAMKLLDSVIEDEAERGYYDTLRSTLQALSDLELTLSGVQMWFYCRLLALTGHGINVKTNQSGQPLKEGQLYAFSPDDMCFTESKLGDFRSDHIKLLRLALHHQPGFLKQVQNADELTTSLVEILRLQVPHILS